jgi:hypothetical protein
VSIVVFSAILLFIRLTLADEVVASLTGRPHVIWLFITDQYSRQRDDPNYSLKTVKPVDNQSAN